MKKPGAKQLTLKEYQEISEEISNQVIDFQEKLLFELMPEKHANLDAFYYVALKVATKVICAICLNDMTAREKLTEKFIETLPELVKEAIVVDETDIDKTRH